MARLALVGATEGALSVMLGSEKVADGIEGLTPCVREEQPATAALVAHRGCFAGRDSLNDTALLATKQEPGPSL
jgi:hypothetical protein